MIVGGGEDNRDGVGVVARPYSEFDVCRFGGCEDGGGVIEDDGGGGELYFGRFSSRI